MIPPDLAVEVVSPNDLYNEVDDESHPIRPIADQNRRRGGMHLPLAVAGGRTGLLTGETERRYGIGPPAVVAIGGPSSCQPSDTGAMPGKSWRLGQSLSCLCHPQIRRKIQEKKRFLQLFAIPTHIVLCLTLPFLSILSDKDLR